MGAEAFPERQAASPRGALSEVRGLGERFAERYVLLEKIGEGGMGVVWSARDEVTGRSVALKQVHSARLGSKRRTAEALFEREFHTLARLKHPRIIEVYEYGVSEAGPYYTMELLTGKDLGALKGLPYPEACRHLRDAASSLALLHAHRLVHRDVSPRNVRVTSDGRAKLIDFGALAPFGPTNDIVGTPQCIAPEAFYLGTLDQRTDLFGLGVVAYWVLTGKSPYGARRLEDLYAAWQKSPVPPSELVAGIPQALDRLVLSLLSLDPLGRPVSAALVIDRLTAIGGLEPEPVEHAAESYLSSTRMVGREREGEWLRHRIERALEGRGSELVIEGAAGVGKTRLLYELCIDAQLKGLITLRADAQAAPEPFGVAATLAMGALRALPDVARRTAAPHAGWLGHLSQALRDELSENSLNALPQDPGERRARLQTALHGWFQALGRERPLLIAVDNIQDADDNSAAFLATLGRETKDGALVVAVTQRAGARIVAPAAVRMMRQRAGRLKLAGLSPEACQELARCLFGDVANVGRIAHLLYDKGAGVPQQCMDFARVLVKRKIATYANGTWVLPTQVFDAELPSRSEELLSTRLADLGATARLFASALSVESGPVELDRCLQLFPGAGESEAYAALDELVAEQVLLFGAGWYRFSQQSVREALLADMGDDVRKGCHRRAAETLLALPSLSLNRRAAAAGHLIQSGEEMRGADILARAGREFLASADLHDSSDRVTDALEQALRLYERSGRSDYEIAGLMMPLISISFFSASWRIVVEYGERAIPLGAKITGLELGHKLRPYIGRFLALIVALLVGAVRFASHRRRGLHYDLKEAISWYCAIVPAIAGTASIHLDVERAERIRKAVLPLSLFGDEHVAGLMCQYASAQSLMLQGRLYEARELFEAQLASYQKPEVRALLGEGNWKAIYGGILFVLGIFECYRFGEGPSKYAKKIHALDYRVWEMAAEQLTLLHHAYRGEAQEAEVYRERMELFAVQGNTTWQVEVFWPAVLLNADALTGDTVAARRTWELLDRQAKNVPALAPFAAVAHAVYLALRGEVSNAVELYEGVPKNLTGVVALRGFFAQALNLAGEHARAKAVASAEATGVFEKNKEAVIIYLEPDRQRALAEAGLGNPAEGARQIDGLLARYGREDSPLLVGLLHEARATIALMQSDRGAFDRHFRDMETRFRGTKNPVLIGRCEQMAAAVDGAGKSRREGDGQEDTETVVVSSFAGLSELSRAADPSDCALRLVAREAKARSGFLYLIYGGELRLTASSERKEPPVLVEAALRRRAEQRQLETEEPPDSGDEKESATAILSPVEADGVSTMNRSVLVRSAPPSADDGGYQVIVLESRKARRVVGGVILETSFQNAHSVPPEYLERMASALAARSVVTTAS